MKLCRILLLVFTSLASVAISGVAAEHHRRAIFDGRTLDGWHGNDKYWSVVDGAITGQIPKGALLEQNEFLFHERVVHDFELSLQFRISGDQSANSGIQFRSRQIGNRGAAGYQADLDMGDVWLGRIYDELGRGLLAERFHRVSIAPDGRRWSDEFEKADVIGQLADSKRWHMYRIVATGPHVEVWIDGNLWSTLDDHEMDEADFSGRLAFQLHSGPGPVRIQFRDIQLTDLGKTQLPTVTAAIADPDNRQTQSPVLWHLRPNTARSSSIANNAAQSVVAEMMLTDGFQAELIAAEPDIHQPIALSIDERGRLWIAEAFSYPNKQSKGDGKDRIRILEDADGDGSFESKKTFIDGLNLISGMEVGFGGIWVGAAPELLFIPDRDGDDHPDGPPQVVLDGFGYQDTHETLNSFTWGPDGWLYGNQGVFNTAAIGKPGASDDDRVAMRAGVWRYHPVRDQFEIFAYGGSNQWGLAFNDSGHLFMTHCRSYWGGGGTTYVIRNGHYWNQTNSNYPPYISNSAPIGIARLKNFLPASARYGSGEGGAGKRGSRAIYGGHSHVGTMIYLGDNWPAIYRNRLFTHNLHGHQLNHQINVRRGSAYETLHAGFDLMYAPDPAYIPVDLKYGPDGAVYVIDWVDRQHCHNPRAEFWDRTNGRVYRISWADTYRPVSIDLTAMTDIQLLDFQVHPNRWYGRTARRILQQRAAKRSIDEDAIRRLKRQAGDPENEAAIALRSLWTLHVMERLDPDIVESALKHESDIVRAWAVRLGTDNAGEWKLATDLLEELAQSDSSPTVRLALASAMPDLPDSGRWRIGTWLARHEEDAADRFLPKMLWYGLSSVVRNDVRRAMKIVDSTPLKSLADSICWYLTRGADGRDVLTERIADSSVSDTEARHLLSILHFGLRYDSSLPMPNDWRKARSRVRDSGSAAVNESTDELSAVFGDEVILRRMRSTLADVSASMDRRRHALSILKRVNDQPSVPIYLSLIDEPQLRSDIIPLLSQASDQHVAPRLIAIMPELHESEKNAVLDVLTSRAENALALLDAVKSNAIARSNLTALQIRQMHNLGNQRVNRALEEVWGKVGNSSDESRHRIGRIRKDYKAAPLWAYSEKRGRKIFDKVCAQCHPLDGTSTPLGPSLAGAWRNGLDYFLENIIDPNAVVGENFRTTLVETRSGAILSGLFEGETDSSIVIRTADKTISVPKTEVEQLRTTQQSIMPTGLLDNLSEIERIELLKFLMSNR